MKATRSLDRLACFLVLDCIGPPPEADEFVHLLCLPDAVSQRETPRGRGVSVELGSPPARG